MTPKDEYNRTKADKVNALLNGLTKAETLLTYRQLNISGVRMDNIDFTIDKTLHEEWKRDNSQ